MLRAYNTTNEIFIDKECEFSKKNPIEIRNLLFTINFQEERKENRMKEPSIALMKYLPYIKENYVEKQIFTKKYDYNPEQLSFDLYHTYDLWYLLLMLNNCKDRIEFVGHEFNVLKIMMVPSFMRFIGKCKEDIAKYEKTNVATIDDSLILKKI